MAKTKISNAGQEGTATPSLATAKNLNLPISTKHSIEISKYLRYKNTQLSKQFLQEVIDLKKPVPFKTFVRNVGHKTGISAGRFPRKSAKEFLKLIKSVEANAHSKGMETANLKIVKLVANKASLPVTGGRHRHGTKRTHLEIAVREMPPLKKAGSLKREKKSENVAAVQKPEQAIKLEVKEK